MTRLDPTDARIVAHLKRHGRLSHREVSEALGIPATTVRQRIQRLEARKAIRIALIVDRSITGRSVAAHVQLYVDPHRLDEFIAHICALDEVQFVGRTVGDYNLFLFVSGADAAAVHAVARDHLTAARGVRDLAVSPIAQPVMHDYKMARLL